MSVIKRAAPLLAALGLMALTLSAYWPVLECEFINYDDNKYVTDNPHVQVGLNVESSRWAFTSTYAANWHPLTWLSHMADCQLFKLNPRGHHFTNLLLHVCNTLLLFTLLRQFTGSLWRSAAVAAFFGVHPAHVESVAWVAERKDVLSTLFFLLTLWAYGRYAKGSSRREKAPSEAGTRSVEFDRSLLRPAGSAATRKWYLLALIFFTLGLMSKPMLVTLPFVLLLLDFWPLRRLHQRIRLVLLEKLPFFVLSGASCVVTYLAQRAGRAVVPVEVFTIDWRCVNALASYLKYVVKLFWPCDLAVIYPLNREWSLGWASAAAAFLLLGGLLAFRLRRTAPYLLVGGAWFVGTLVPVIGLVQVGEQAMADRYTYIPSIGLAIAACWGLPDLLSVVRKKRPATQPDQARPASQDSLRKISTVALPLLTLLVLVCLLGLTRRQLGYWHDSISLFEHAIAVTKNNCTARATLGAALQTAGRSKEAVQQYQLALQVCPGHVLAHNNYGVALARESRYAEAIAQYEAALETSPDNAEAHLNLANALNPSYVDPHTGLAPSATNGLDSKRAAEHYQASLRSDPARVEAYVNWGNLELAEGRFDRAQALYESALCADPRSWLACFNLGNLFSKTQRTNEAIASFSNAAQLRPADAETRLRLGNLLARRGDFENAIPQFETARKLRPDDWLAWNNLGGALSQVGKVDEAVRCLGEALRLSPENAQIRFGLGKALLIQGKREQALAEYSEAVRLEPANVETRRQLALLFQQQGKREQALEEYSAVVELEPQDPSARYELAVALAKAGQTPIATKHFREAVRLKPDWVQALNNLAWLLATDENSEVRNGAQAVEVSQRACELSHYKEARVLGTLDAAYAEAGRFDDAIQTAERTRNLALESGQTNLAVSAERRLNLYRAGKPYRESLKP